VALRAVRTEFPPVNVGVALGAILAHIRENWFYVAFRAFHIFVHATQRVIGLVVIEFRHGTNGPPSRGRVAVFTGNRQPPVRALRGAPLRKNIRD
jgi:hypothetical protein